MFIILYLLLALKPSIDTLTKTWPSPSELVIFGNDLLSFARTWSVANSTAADQIINTGNQLVGPLALDLTESTKIRQNLTTQFQTLMNNRGINAKIMAIIDAN
ncbi:unnamed protein product, partial [Protopolystoma xenopodis]